DDMDGVGSCRKQAPGDSFNPGVQWEWLGEGTDTASYVSPLVANLTDDNGDGDVDLCDVPDIVVVAAPNWGGLGHIYVLDGATGSVHFSIAQSVFSFITPALGDVDGDGLPEIVTVSGGILTAFNNDGSLAWSGSAVNMPWHQAVAIADVDNDGNAEIMLRNQLFDHQGSLLWSANVPMQMQVSATTAADLDGDGDLEIVFGSTAVHHDGSLAWETPLGPGFPQVADLDLDGLPEVLLTNSDGIALLEHDGAVVYEGLRPTGAAAGGLNWVRPATIHDFDGDTEPEFATCAVDEYTAYEVDASVAWTTPVSDTSGVAGGTAFDFLGDGEAEAMFADEQSLYVFDTTGAVQMQVPRISGTAMEYPVVADVDNDGSAEIVVVGNFIVSGAASPAVQVIRDVDDNWIQARRIWNQHTYHVTNVREDGTIPQFEVPSWQDLNTFRTNAQIEGGRVCQPEPKVPE
nr:FG-GAP-like repeat-containing protein [Deltaproteobacteria bacterium]